MYEWFDHFRVCLLCHQYGSPLDIMCETCWDYFYDLSDSKADIESDNYNFRVKRLWVWNELSDEYVRKVIYNLKKGHSHKVFLKLAQCFLSQINFQHSNNKQMVFVSAPATKAKHNHALYLAKALADLTGCLYLDIFTEPLKNKKQKRLGFRERSKRKMSMTSSVRAGPNKLFIFVDDVITTGATAKAAYNALGKPINFEVWVLAEKTKNRFRLYE